jgi:hypothetical protein
VLSAGGTSMRHLIRRVRGSALFSLILLVGSLVRAEAQLPKVSITLMPDVPYEKVFGHYVLYGSFGAHGGFVQKPGSRTLQIPVVVEGKPASQIKMFIGAPGCRMATFDIPILNLLDTQESFSCSPAPTVTLVGQISPASLLRNTNATVSVDYMAGWACRFFGFADCMVPQTSFGTAKPDAEGIFKIELPDFSLDSNASDSDDGQDLQLILRDAKTYNILAFLEPESEALRTASGNVRISAFYPQKEVFVARRKR